MKASDLFVKALENEGVEYIFAVPGEENLDLVESLRTSNIKLIVTRHEQGAGFMAATLGRLTEKTGVCLSTLGPGATNLVTAAAYAQLGAMPMLMITGQKPIKSSPQGRFQIVDVVEMMQPLTKSTKQIVDAHNIPPLIRQCFRLAEQERPGAVHLELPEDIAREDCQSSVFAKTEFFRSGPESYVIDAAVEMIEEAKKPLVLIGAGANRKRTTEALENFINKTGIPFFNTQMGKGVVDERHPLFMGTAALSDGDFVHCAIHQADLIVNVGHDVVEKPPFLMVNGGAKVLHVNFFPAHFDDVYFPQLEVIGDITSAINMLSEVVTKQESWKFDEFIKIKKEIDKEISEGHTDDRFPIFPPRLVCDVRKVMPSDGILTLDNGMYKIWFARNYQAHQPNTILLDNALATMGAGLSSGMAAKMVRPKQKVVVICGDGGFMMNSHELELAVRLKLDLVILVLRDDAYGMIKWKQENMHFTDFGLDFGNPDFVQYANSYGAHGHRVKSTKEFSELLATCLEEKGVHLIEVPVNYSENVEALGKGLKERICQFE